jgi:Zn-dependent metalloprotease
MSGFNNWKNSVYNGLGAQAVDALNITPLKAEAMPGHFAPNGVGVIPPYMLEELAARNPGNGDFLKTRNKSIELEQQKPADITPKAGQNGGAAREVYDAGGQEVQPGKLVRTEGQKASGNIEADRAYDYTGEIRDFYLKEYGRNGIDGKGMKFISTVNYGENFENAFWDGKQMTYGKPGPDSPFKTFVLRDVAGHEITHGVTEMEAGTQYRGQSGALNESYSDVFGELVNQYAQKQTADQGHWVTGEGIWKDNIKGRGLRDMLNPGTAYDDPALGKDPQPAHMKDYVKTWSDNGGVHINSGIPNKAFATFAQAVGGNAWDDPGHIWFEARKLAGADPSFGSFAGYTLEAAQNMGKTDLIPKLKAAWSGVGVTPDIHAVDTLTPGSGAAIGAMGAGLGANTGVSYIRNLLNQKAS